MNMKDWFEINYIKKDLIIIRENLNQIDPRYYTLYSNIYLINGNKKSLLIDTGSGLFSLKPIIQNLIEDKPLIIINTHAHFDHIGSNYEFDEVFIHKNELDIISKPMDISFLKSSPNKIVSLYERSNFIISPTKNPKVLKDTTTFDLGNLKVKILNCPGHSEGSISLYTNRGELFTGDNAHYGAMYLPIKKELPSFIKMIRSLVDLCIKENIDQIFPSHEDYNLDRKFLSNLIDCLNKIDSNLANKKFDDFNNCWKIDIGKFMFMIKRE